MGHKEMLKLKNRLLVGDIAKRNLLEKVLKQAVKESKTKVMLATYSQLRRLDARILELQMEIMILKEKIRQKKTR